MMVCESMAEDPSEGSFSNTVKNDQFMSTDDYAPKVRKPYTITKQRERWTEDEHKKFLEALKLYGRAWRRIEEHVGTKTAVQIRSHAQKFFSKVVRESTTSGDVREVKPIEIPPPRPKRKPMHPYPRKLSAPLKTGGHNAGSTSPNSSGSDQDNQSPTSVLSNMFALGDSCSPTVGSSPVSSNNGIRPGGGSPDLDQSPEENESSPQNPMKLEEQADESTPDVEVGSAQCLKLFGKTVVVTDSHNQPSSPNDHLSVNLFPQQNLMPINPLPCGAPIYYMQFLDENTTDSATSWWSLYGGMSYPVMQNCNPATESSNTGSGEIGEKKKFLVIGSGRSAFTKQYKDDNGKIKKEKCIKGFVPYKRCLEQSQRQSHSISNGEEREEQRIRLCL